MEKKESKLTYTKSPSNEMNQKETNEYRKVVQKGENALVYVEKVEHVSNGEEIWKN